MEQVLEFFGELIPYLLFIPIGMWVSKKNWIPKKIVTTPLIYLLMPVLVVNHVLEAEGQTILVLPAMGFLLAVLMNIPAWIAYKTFAKDENPFLVSSSFSFFNVAFFGIPTVLALYGQQGITTLITIYIGTAFYGDVIGYYHISRSQNGGKESLKKTLQVPFLYAFMLAVVLRWLQVEIPDAVDPVVDIFSYIVSAAGMMIIGMNVSDIQFKGIDWAYLGKFMALRTTFAIGLTVAIMAGEFFLLDMLGDEEREFMALIPLFPIAANVTVFASFLGSKEKESGLLILTSMALSLILIPIVIQLFD